MSNFDVIVIGSGINSLTAASLLGQAGRKVTLLEAREQIGGMSSTEEFAKGFRCNTINDYIRWIDPRLLATLNLKDHGLDLRWNYQPVSLKITPPCFRSGNFDQ